MLYHIDSEKYIITKNIIAIFDYKNITKININKNIFNEEHLLNKEIFISNKEIKSIILLDTGKYYLSTIGIKTLNKRWNS